MQERKFYSKGFNAEVYEVNPQERLWFPHADLVRLDKPKIEGVVGDKNRFKRLFYRHKIAQALFPDNFINVVAARTETREGLYEDRMLSTKTHKLHKLLKSRRDMFFSQKADISIEHSTFSAHMRPGYELNEKVSSCKCNDCISHRTFHFSSALAEKANEVSISMRRIGVSPAYFDDPSDYCLTGKGNIVFFEIDEFEFDSTVLEKYLSSLGNPNSREKEALMLINRYNKLLKEM